MNIKFALLFLVTASQVWSSPKDLPVDLVETTLGITGADGHRLYDSTKTYSYGTRTYQAPHENWGAFVEATWLKLKAALIERGWTVVDGGKNVTGAAAGSSFDVKGTRPGETMRLCVSLFPAPEKNSVHIAYTLFTQ